ncbi:glycoside hydrolase family 43 protein [Algoriphagus machipongonensis]|uniref:Xylosidase/arabinosidase n=1 Tax=Algoriphagus machipongonensis TaxID=388413 RepID=A3HZ16_9BACT|nr:glycoside hydrolase family 43 protein [Algoriphagus machipongonensis]EAZ80502.1 xylosidase/arabinosidase [Algoriphagus machipongonensis]
MKNLFKSLPAITLSVLLLSCNKPSETTESIELDEVQESTSKYLSQPLVSDHYTADPSAHYFDGKIYIYPSHDVESDVPQDDLGSHFNMMDYHVYSMESPTSPIVDAGKVLGVDDIPWAKRQLWAPDAAEKDGTYYLYFPAKDENDIFKIGVASGSSPTGPFTAQPEPIQGSYSIDPSVYEDTDGSYYMYFGGIWGGQLQKYRDNKFEDKGPAPTDGLPADDEPALGPIIAKMSDNMLEFAETPKEIKILDQNGSPILNGDNERRFFEAAWVHKYEGKYYLSYSTGDTHFIAYATADNPYGPFTYQGVVLNPVEGWTNHHSIVEVDGDWYLYYHDTQLSGETHLRNIKMTKLTHLPDGSIQTIDPNN